jgi:hypothetical protein
VIKNQTEKGGKGNKKMKHKKAKIYDINKSAKKHMQKGE